MYNEKNFIHGFVRPLDIQMAAPAAPPAAMPNVPLPVPPEVQNAVQQVVANEVARQHPQPNGVIDMKSLSAEYQHFINHAVSRQLELEKAKIFNEAPLFIGNWKRVMQLVGLGIAAVLLWEGGKWVVEQIWPSNGARPRTAPRT